MSYSAEWNSPENEKRREEAEREQLDRDWSQIEEVWAKYIAKPFWWALATTIWIFVAIKLMEPEAY